MGPSLVRRFYAPVGGQARDEQKTTHHSALSFRHRNACPHRNAVSMQSSERVTGSFRHSVIWSGALIITPNQNYLMACEKTEQGDVQAGHVITSLITLITRDTLLDSIFGDGDPGWLRCLCKEARSETHFSETHFVECFSQINLIT